jgi:P27 family predicted phage terminase small subunit
MSPGPAPKPTALKKLAGNPGQHKLNDAEPKPQAAMMQAPRHLDKVANAEWRRISRELYQLGLLTRIDRAGLAAYCQAYSRWVQASEELEGKPLMLLTENGYAYANPLISIINGSLETMKKFMTEFGMTPSARSRIRIEKPEEPDALDMLLFGQNVKVGKNG